MSVVVLFLVSLFFSFSPRPVQATNSAIISAPNVVSTQLGPGNVTTFAINVSNVGPSPETLHAWQLFLYVNPAILKITQVIEGPALSDIATALGGTTLFTGHFNATSGLVRTDDLIIIPAYPDAGFVGNGTLVYVKAQVLAFGKTSLVMNNTSLISVLNNVVTDVQHTVVNGLFSNVPYNLPPTASFTISPSQPIATMITTFDGSSSSDPDGRIVRYSWNFGDGNTTVATVPVITHTYTRPGILRVNLTVTDDGAPSGIPAYASAVKIANVVGYNSPPIAVFTFSPISPTVHQTVTFDATGSYDPDGDFIYAYYWKFGDGFTAVNGGPIVQHMYNDPRTYNVTLTVSDSCSCMLRTSISKFITVTAPIIHDVAIVSLQAYPTTVVSGQSVNVNVGLMNLGIFNETADLTVYYDSHVAVTVHGIEIPVAPYTYYVNAVWGTFGVTPGNYTLSATVFLSTDQNPLNNHLSDGQVTILPPPVIVLTPSSGPVGTRVSVHGSGFSSSGPTNYPVTVDVSFDDQFVGFTTTTNGTFNFIFNVPIAQSGFHQIHALAGFYPIPVEATANFVVIPTPTAGGAGLVISVGNIYFPGDAATVFVLSSLNGSPTQAQTIHLTLILPSGTSTSLTLASTSPGLYKATYTVPTTGSFGTYALVATAKINGINATSLGSFEVKPTWLEANGHAIATASTIAGAIGAVSIVGFAWRKGYFTKRKDEFPIP